MCLFIIFIFYCADYKQQQQLTILNNSLFINFTTQWLCVLMFMLIFVLMYVLICVCVYVCVCVYMHELWVAGIITK